MYFIFEKINELNWILCLEFIGQTRFSPPPWRPKQAVYIGQTSGFLERTFVLFLNMPTNLTPYLHVLPPPSVTFWSIFSCPLYHTFIAIIRFIIFLMIFYRFYFSLYHSLSYTVFSLTPSSPGWGNITLRCLIPLLHHLPSCRSPFLSSIIYYTIHY